MSYTLYLIDYDRHRDQLPPRDSIRDLNAVGALLKRLDGLKPGPNSRFEQLARYLLQRFPLKPSEPNRGASAEEIEAYQDADESAWRGNNDPVAEVRALRGAMWLPDIVPDRMPEFLDVLLPKARELGLDVYDDQLGIYYSAIGTVVPLELKVGHEASDSALPLKKFGVVWKSDIPALVAEATGRYVLNIFDWDRNWQQLPFSSSVKTLDAIDKIIEKLDGHEAGPSIRFERLARHLSESFPVKPSAGESVWNADPVEEVRRLKSVVWKPEIVSGRAREFLEVLLPLARGLGLDVYDPQMKMFVSASEPVVPREREAARRALDPGALQPIRFTQASLRRAFIERLTPLLGPLGFERQAVLCASFFYQRSIEGGKQVIMGNLESYHSNWECKISIKCMSDRYRAFQRAMDPTPPEYEIFPDSSTTFLSEYLASIRELQPGWRNEGSRSAIYVRTPEEIDWMVQDLLALGLPILEKARTVEGVGWLISSEEAQSIFPDNLCQCADNRTIAFRWVVPYLRMAGNPRFDEITDFLIKYNEGLGMNSWFPQELRELVDFCRTQVQPVWTGPA